MKTKDTESDKSQESTNADETNSNKTPYGDELRLQTKNDQENKPNQQIVVHEKIGESPIHVTGNDEVGYFATLGTYKITNHYKTREEVIDKVIERDYEVIIGIVNATADLNNIELIKQYNLNK